MADARIIYQVNVDTKPLEKQLNKLKWRMRFALFLIKIAEKIGRKKVVVSIDMEQLK